MELNNNIQNGMNNAGVQMAGVPVAPVSGDIVFSDKPKKSRAMVIWMVVLIILAVGGIGFGIGSWMIAFDKGMRQEEEIMTLRSQLAEATESVVEEDTTVVDVETEGDVSTDVNTADYIYVGEWGLKIKIPETLKMVSYTLQSWGANGPTTLYVSGSVRENDKKYDFVNMTSSGLGAVSREEKSDNNEPKMCTVVFSDEKYDYCYSRGNGTLSSNETELELERQSGELITEILTNPENYSKI